MSEARPLNGPAPGPPLPAHLVDPHPDRLDANRADHAVIIDAHRRAVAGGQPSYVDPSTGYTVLSARFLWERGTCCDSGCRHCPYQPNRAAEAAPTVRAPLP